MNDMGASCGTAVLLRKAADGEESAWRELVDRHGGVVWGTARAYSANLADAEDVWQVTWLQLAENMHKIHKAEALPGWLVTTARRESSRLARARRRESPVGLGNLLADIVDTGAEPESSAIRAVFGARLAQAFAQLSQRCQQLLRVLAVAPEASYEQIGAALGMARGSIGPKKQRCLVALRERLAALSNPEEVVG